MSYRDRVAPEPSRRKAAAANASSNLEPTSPFVLMGLITVFYLLVWYHARLLALLVTASFACYMGVVLYARQKPMMGMLMIPKTICYIWMIGIFLAAL